LNGYFFVFIYLFIYLLIGTVLLEVLYMFNFFCQGVSAVELHCFNGSWFGQIFLVNVDITSRSTFLNW